jgi:hypothetical protein
MRSPSRCPHGGYSDLVLRPERPLRLSEMLMMIAAGAGIVFRLRSAQEIQAGWRRTAAISSSTLRFIRRWP